MEKKSTIIIYIVLGFISFEEIGAIIARKGKGGNVGLVHSFSSREPAFSPITFSSNDTGRMTG